MSLEAYIEGIGLVGPGFAGWSASRDILAGRAARPASATVIPAAEALPPTERRRAGKCVRLSLAVGIEAARNAGREARDLAAIFTSSTGDGDNLNAICEQLATDDRLISPTRFHNSVHNAPAGYWGIATGAMHPADSLAAFDGSFAAGLLEALARTATHSARPVLLVAYDAPYPEPLNAARPMPDSFAVGLVISAHAATPGAPLIRVVTSQEPPEKMRDPRPRSATAVDPRRARDAAAGAHRRRRGAWHRDRIPRRPVAGRAGAAVNAPLERDWLLANLPHQGSMSLLGRIVSWDSAMLRAVADNHRDSAHPLRRNGELPIASGIEYAAQAAAAHGALSSGAASPAGVIASVRGVSFHARRLDDVPHPLDIVVQQLGESGTGALYRFEVSAAGAPLVDGRLAVVFKR